VASPWETAAGKCWGAVVASSLIVIALIVIAGGVLLGAFLKLSFAIRKEDRGRRGTLRSDAPSRSAQSARAVVGLSRLNWD
jgi:hypothetical protein